MTRHPECTVMGHDDCDMCSGCDRLRQRDNIERTLVLHPEDVTIARDHAGRILAYVYTPNGISNQPQS